MLAVRTLLVDDSHDFLRYLQTFLATWTRVEVIGTAVSGEYAIEQVLALQPDLVLLDLLMPGMNGFEALQRIKSLKSPPRVVLLTFQDEPPLRERAEQFGADGYLVKPELARCFGPLIETLFPSDPCVREDPKSRNPMISCHYPDLF